MTKHDLQLSYACAKNNALFTPLLTCDQHYIKVSNFPPYSTHLHRKHGFLTVVTIVLHFKLDKVPHSAPRHYPLPHIAKPHLPTTPHSNINNTSNHNNNNNNNNAVTQTWPATAHNLQRNQQPRSRLSSMNSKGYLLISSIKTAWS